MGRLFLACGQSPKKRVGNGPGNTEEPPAAEKNQKEGAIGGYRQWLQPETAD